MTNNKNFIKEGNKRNNKDNSLDIFFIPSINKRLKNTKDIQNLRKEWLILQKNIDPITKEIIQNPVLDHDHDTGYCRSVLDRDTNQFIGKIESSYKRFLKWKKMKKQLPDILRNIANYLDKNYSKLHLHPYHIKKSLSLFKSLNSKEQIKILEKNNLNTPGKNIRERLKQYKIILKNES